MDQANYYKVILIKKGSSKIKNFVTPRTGVLVLGRGHKNKFSPLLILQHINCCIKGKLRKIHTFFCKICTCLYNLHFFGKFYTFSKHWQNYMYGSQGNVRSFTYILVFCKIKLKYLNIVSI